MSGGANGGWQHMPGYYQQPYQPAQLLPSHITHSWAFGNGFGGDPLAVLAKALDRLAAAIEQHNEIASKATGTLRERETTATRDPLDGRE
jgi:hypothetical protein